MFVDVYNIIVETGELHWTDWNDYKLNKSALGYIATILDLQTTVCKCVQNSKVLDQFI